MAIGKFSSSVEASLLGRPDTTEKVEEIKDVPQVEEKSAPAPERKPVSRPKKTRTTKKKEEPAADKKKAGRPAMKDSEKKVQKAITISADTAAKLEKWSKTKRKSYTVYLSEYIEDNLDTIIKYFK